MAGVEEAVTNQKYVIEKKAQEFEELAGAIIDNWAKNYNISEEIKTKRTEQLNSALGFINWIANTGAEGLTELATEVTDTELSKKLLEINQKLIGAAAVSVQSIKKSEDEFQNTLKEKYKDIKNQQPESEDESKK